MSSNGRGDRRRRRAAAPQRRRQAGPAPRAKRTRTLFDRIEQELLAAIADQLELVYRLKQRGIPRAPDGDGRQEPGTLYDAARFALHRYEDGVRLSRRISTHLADLLAPRLRPPQPGASHPLDRLLEAVGRLVVRDPVTAQAIFSALVAEGRRFARTPEGSRWRARLARSELVRRGRAWWEASLLNVLEDHQETILPAAIFDALAQMASRREFRSDLRRTAAPSRRRSSRSRPQGNDA